MFIKLAGIIAIASTIAACSDGATSKLKDESPDNLTASILGDWHCQKNGQASTHFIFSDTSHVNLPTDADPNGVSFFDRASKDLVAHYELSGAELAIHVDNMIVHLAQQDYSQVATLVQTGNFTALGSGTVMSKGGTQNVFGKVSIHDGAMTFVQERSTNNGKENVVSAAMRQPESCQRAQR
jgi:hypothetical protein